MEESEINSREVQLYTGQHATPVSTGEQPATAVTRTSRFGYEPEGPATAVVAYMLSKPEWDQLTREHPEHAPPLDKVEKVRGAAEARRTMATILTNASEHDVHTHVFSPISRYEPDDGTTFWYVVLVPPDWYRTVTNSRG